jgi:hypothetical protein
MTLVFGQPIQLYKTPGVAKLLYPLPCRKFPFFVFIFNLLFPSSQEGVFPQFPQPFDPLRTQLIHQDNPFNDKTGTQCPENFPQPINLSYFLKRPPVLSFLLAGISFLDRMKLFLNMVAAKHPGKNREARP